ncbi:MAG: N-acetyltransferase [Patescibacteria group bacterium]
MNKSFTNRPASIRDVNTLALINMRAYAHRDNVQLPASPSSDEVEYFNRKLSDPKAWADVALRGCEVAGFILGYPRILEGSESPDAEYISLLAVDPRFMGQGAASYLMQLAVKRAQQVEREKIVLWTARDSNEHAQSVYKHLGFTLSGMDRDSDFGPQVEFHRQLINTE